MGRFWMPDSFVRVHAKNLSSSAHSVFMSLSSHANANGETFISLKKIGDELDFSKNTVKRAVDELIAYQILVRLNKKTGRASHLKILSVPNGDIEPSQNLGAKELNKEFIKEDFFKNSKPRNSDIEPIKEVLGERRKQVLENLRQNLISKGIYRERPKNS